MLDCVIIGGGPAGMNAALVLGRARKNIVLFDEDKPRNSVTHESHGFITRDGIAPAEFKRLAKEDLQKYPSISLKTEKVTGLKKENNIFLIKTSSGNLIQSRKVILATGVKDQLPPIKGLKELYGKSVFHCPFCDGWELRERKLVVVSEMEGITHMVKLLTNWSDDIIVCSNGKKVLTGEEKELLASKGIRVLEDEIAYLHGEEGQLQEVVFTNGERLERNGGFVGMMSKQASPLADIIGCKVNENGGIITDEFGRTNIEGVYASGDTSTMPMAQLIFAASDGSRAGITVVSDLLAEDF